MSKPRHKPQLLKTFDVRVVLTTTADVTAEHIEDILTELIDPSVRYGVLDETHEPIEFKQVIVSVGRTLLSK